jgi:ATP-dependent helicase/nuclease subunit A
MIALTDRQRAALEVRGASVALASGAGCGKTSVLTARFLMALDEYDDGLAALVALTFTEKAARELRGRIRAEGRRRLAEDVARWRAVLRGLEAAPISTFHGFCQGLLSRWPLEAGLEPGFGVLEEAMAPALRRRAIDAVMRSWLADQRPDLIALGVEYGLEEVRGHLSPLVANHGPDELARWANLDADDVLAAWRGAWEGWGRESLVGELVERTRELLALLAVTPCGHAVMARRVAYLLEHVPALPSATDARARLVEIAENAQVKGGGGKNAWPDEAVYQRVMSLLTRLRGEARKLAELIEFDEEAAAKAATLGLRFARLALEARRAYDQAKAARGLLDFDDLLRYSLVLIERADACQAEELARCAQFLLVDEFQDTDATQGRILERLAGQGLASGRLFLVGDSKQSIYRFRGAEPRIFEDYRNRMPTEGRKDLTENFRGLPDVLDFVNALFADTFPNEPPLEAGPGAPARDGHPHVHFLWASDGTDDEDDTSDEAPEHRPNAEARRKCEAEWLARWLAARLAAGWTIYDRLARAYRRATAGDVAMLFRTLNDVRFIETALVEAGLDYHEVGGAAFYSRREVIDLVNLLAAIDDPLDAPAVAATLRGPFFNVSDEGLYWLAERRDMSGLGDLIAGFEPGDLHPALSAEDRARVTRARDLFHAWRKLRDRVPLADLIDRVLAESGHEATLIAEGPLGPRRRANLRKLVALARGYDRQGGWALSDLVARLRADVRDRKPPREEEATTTEEVGESVRLMTIHQAKGLEFPIVVLPDLNRDGRDTRAAVVLDKDLGMLVRPSTELGEVDNEAERLNRPNTGWTLHERRECEEEEAEALRIFYVATTRAETHLVLSAGFQAGRDEPKSPALRLLSQRFDLATGGLKATWPDERRPLVEIITGPPPELANPRVARTGADLPGLAALIRNAGPVHEDPGPGPARPRHLDLDPARWLPPTAARLDRLVRELLAGPFRDDAFVARVIRHQVPAPSPRLVARAEARIRYWMERDPDIARRLGRASGVVRAWSWHVAWPEDAPDSSIFQGAAEFLVPRRDGRWAIWLVSDPGVPENVEWLRLHLSALAAERAGHVPVAQGRLFRLGDSTAEVLEAVDFSPRSLEAAWRSFVPTPRA